MTDLWSLRWALIPVVSAAWAAWYARAPRLTIGIATAGFCLAGVAHASHARELALHTPLRHALHREFGGFAMGALANAGRHDPVQTRGRLVEDAAVTGNVVTLRVHVQAVRLHDEWRTATGTTAVTVGGRSAETAALEWRAGRAIQFAASYRRPQRYLNDGVPDSEYGLALDGTTLFASVKSGLLVDVLSPGGAVEEWAARTRMAVRHNVRHWVARHDTVSAAIVTAILIGDRAGLPEDVRRQLQVAGTYHVIAISGGNIAILAGLTLLMLASVGVTGRPAALATVLVLLAYAHVVSSGASVWRATLMAAVYLVSRLLDHRSPPWQAMAVTAALLVSVRPLDVRDVGFLLTFGATAALLEAARRTGARRRGNRAAAWVLGSVAASIAAELALLPVSALAFSRVTTAGLVLNLVAVPLMGAVQIAGMVVATLASVDVVVAPAGWFAHVAAQGLIASAGLVELAPWLTTRVPPPPAVVVVLYYVGGVAWLSGYPANRSAAAMTVIVCAIAIATGSGARPAVHAAAGLLRLTIFDVGQGDAVLMQLPDRSSLLVDTGGMPFGSGFDVGARVLAPAMWSRGVRSLDRLLLTHGDPDHIGGARAAIEDFQPPRVWEGIPVERHAALQDLLAYARTQGAQVHQRRAGESLTFGSVRVRVLHPPAPEWERQRVRNDDSVVLEVLYGDVAILLPGDIGASVERALIPHLTPSRIRILKVAHHGSRTSSSRELLQAWRPQIALISAGRANTFGHPAPEVVSRLEAIGARILRTDLHGQITVETDGQDVALKTFVPESGH